MKNIIQFLQNFKRIMEGFTAIWIARPVPHCVQLAVLKLRKKKTWNQVEMILPWWYLISSAVIDAVVGHHENYSIIPSSVVCYSTGPSKKKWRHAARLSHYNLVHRFDLINSTFSPLGKFITHLDCYYSIFLCTSPQTLHLTNWLIG